MTTIVIAITQDLGHSIFTDGLATNWYGGIYSHNFNKIRKGKTKNEIFLGAGNVSIIERAHQLYLQGKPFKAIIKDNTIIVIAKSQNEYLNLHITDKKSEYIEQMKRTGRYVIIGSGSNFMQEYIENIVKPPLTSQQIINAFYYVAKHDKYSNNQVSVYNFPQYDDIR
jgi:hypothetical protein